VEVGLFFIRDLGENTDRGCRSRLDAGVAQSLGSPAQEWESKQTSIGTTIHPKRTSRILARGASGKNMPLRTFRNAGHHS
jgi:hypothetical protein